MNNKKISIILSSIITIIGIILIFFSTKLGYNESLKVLISKGGMDDIVYGSYTIISMLKYIFIGFLLSLIGGLGLIKIIL